MILHLKGLPDIIKNSVDASIGCVSGALIKDEYLNTIREAGFSGIKIIDEDQFSIDRLASDPQHEGDYPPKAIFD